MHSAPDLARRLLSSGHELGVHTFTHPRLSALPRWRRHTEYAQTQLAIAKAAGVRTPLLRFPYSSQPAAIDDREWELVRPAPSGRSRPPRCRCCARRRR